MKMSQVLVAVVVLFHTLSLVAAPSLQIGPETISNDKVVIPIIFSNDGTVIAMNFDITFDEQTYFPQDFDDNLVQQVSVSNKKPGVLTILITPPLTTPFPVIESGSIFDISFKRKQNSKGLLLLIGKVVMSNSSGKSVKSEVLK